LRLDAGVYSTQLRVEKRVFGFAPASRGTLFKDAGEKRGEPLAFGLIRCCTKHQCLLQHICQQGTHSKN